MRDSLIILLLTILSFPGFCQGSEGVVEEPTTTLHRYLADYSATDNQAVVSSSEFLSFVEKLSLKRPDFKHEKLFLNYLFSKTHHRFLKNFQEYSSFSDLLKNGTYNCLTATALYALLLNHFDIDFNIVETNYHIFLMVQSKQGRILFEATDPTNGFVSNQKEIEERISLYRQNTFQEKRADRNYHHFSFDLYNEVSLQQILGLLYYNHAINAYNQQQLLPTINYLDKAYALYQSPRMEELSRIVLLSVMESNLDVTAKERCVRKIQIMRKRKIEVVASAERISN